MGLQSGPRPGLDFSPRANSGLHFHAQHPSPGLLETQAKGSLKIHGREGCRKRSASPCPPTSRTNAGSSAFGGRSYPWGAPLPGDSKLETHKMDLGTRTHHKCQQDQNIQQSAFRGSWCLKSPWETREEGVRRVW